MGDVSANYDPPLRYQRGLGSVVEAVTSALPPGTSTSRRRRLESQVTALTDELARIAERPDEPTGDVVKFTKRYEAHGKRFSFAARKARDGYWYLTGSQTGRYSWDGLLDFVYDRYGSEKTLKVASGWTALVTS